MKGRTNRPALLVLAGVNGAGKSSVAGARLRSAGLDYFNPDEATSQLRQSGLDETQANSAACRLGRDLLASAIESRRSFAIETTLGGATTPALIAGACSSHDVTLWFVGLDSPERHIARVRARVAKGGHPIPNARIRERWNTSRRNLIALMPRLHELWVYDNSRECDGAPTAYPVALLHMKRGRIATPRSKAKLQATPDWAKPIVEAALRLDGRPRSPRR